MSFFDNYVEKFKVKLEDNWEVFDSDTKKVVTDISNWSYIKKRFTPVFT
jgi:hypothetical protein